MTALPFFLGMISAALLIFAAEAVATRRNQRALTEAYSVIEALHTRLMDPETQARFDQFVRQTELNTQAQLQFDMAQNHDVKPPAEEELIAGINGQGYMAKDLNDLI